MSVYVFVKLVHSVYTMKEVQIKSEFRKKDPFYIQFESSEISDVLDNFQQLVLLFCKSGHSVLYKSSDKRFNLTNITTEPTHWVTFMFFHR